MKKLLMVLIMALTLSITASAREIPSLDRLGSIRITMRYHTNVVTGGEMTLYTVGSIHEDDGNYSFTVTDAFSDGNFELNNLGSATLAKKLSAYAMKQKVSGEVRKINAQGTAEFENLPPALYLLVQNKSSQGFAPVEPFLVSIPMQIQDTYLYDVDASPKMSPLEPSRPENTESPKTGQSGWPMWVFAFSAIGLVVLKRCKREHK